jgi:hypothetical protein
MGGVLSFIANDLSGAPPIEYTQIEISRTKRKVEKKEDKIPDLKTYSKQKESIKKENKKDKKKLKKEFLLSPIFKKKGKPK